jgi:hypothetical protein
VAGAAELGGGDEGVGAAGVRRASRGPCGAEGAVAVDDEARVGGLAVARGAVAGVAAEAVRGAAEGGAGPVAGVAKLLAQRRLSRAQGDEEVAVVGALVAGGGEVGDVLGVAAGAGGGGVAGQRVGAVDRTARGPQCQEDCTAQPHGQNQ